MSIYSRDKRRRAVAAVLVVITLPVLIGFAAVAVDVGVMYNARADMQRAADAAALGAAAEFAYAGVNTDPAAAAKATAKDLVARNLVLGQELTLDAGKDIVFGRAYYNESANTYNFVPGDAPTNAVRVAVRQTEDSPNGALPLYFAAIFGKTEANVSAASVALFVRSCYAQGDCYDTDTADTTVLCHHSDVGFNGDSDSESGPGGADSSTGDTIIVDTDAVPVFLSQGDTLGACAYCPEGDSDDSDDSVAGDSSDSDDSDPGDSDGSTNGDSDDSDDSQGEFGPPDSDDSDDSAAGDSGSSDSGSVDVNVRNALCAGSVKVFLIQ